MSKTFYLLKVKQEVKKNEIQTIHINILFKCIKKKLNTFF